MILQQPKARWAAGAVLAAAVVLLVVVLLPGQRVLFADVLENIRQAKTMVCDVTTTTNLTKSPPGTKFVGIEEPQRGKMSMYVDGDVRAVLHEYKAPGAYVTVMQVGSQDEPAADSQEADSQEAVEPPAPELSSVRSLYLGDKAYVWSGGTVRVLTSLDANQQLNPDEWLRALLEARQDADRRLGEKLINGRRATGFEIAGWKLKYGTRPSAGSPTPGDSHTLLRVWVDVEQDLPTQIEIDQPLLSPQMEGTVHTVFENVQWNVPLDPADFQPPTEAELAQAEEVELPQVNEATFIKFLQSWLDSRALAQAGVDAVKQKAEEKGKPLPEQITGMFGGAILDDGYPEKLDMYWVMGAYTSRLSLAKLVDVLAQQEPLPDNLDDDQRRRLVTERSTEAAKATAEAAQGGMVQATAAGAFYQRLANEGRQPEYFGSDVVPGDAEAVLLRWTLDDGRRRVIYGDLHAETVE